MKRVIRASKYSDKAAHNEEWIGKYATILAAVVESNSEEELASALSGAGGYFAKIKTKRQAIKAMVDQIDYATSEYLLESNAAASLPKVKDDLISYLKQIGCQAIPIEHTPKGFDESYLLIDDEATSDDLQEIASAVARHFGIKPDTGVIGGSWTSYAFKLDGVDFRIGFEEDRDLDPSGKERTLQLGF